MNDHFPYVYEQGHWVRQCEPETVTLAGIIETVIGGLVIAVTLVLCMISWLCM